MTPLDLLDKAAKHAMQSYCGTVVDDQGHGHHVNANRRFNEAGKALKLIEEAKALLETRNDK